MPKIELNVGKNQPPNLGTITHDIVLQFRENSLNSYQKLLENEAIQKSLNGKPNCHA